MTSRLPNASTKVFIVQACFGLGATVSPFISTPFAQKIDRAYLYFLVALGIALSALVVMLLTIQGRTEMQCVGHLPARQDEKRSAGDRAVVELEAQAVDSADADRAVEHRDGSEEESRTGSSPRDMSSGAKMRLMLSTKATWTLVAYNFVYVNPLSQIESSHAEEYYQVGIEVGLGGYIVSDYVLHCCLS